MQDSSLPGSGDSGELAAPAAAGGVDKQAPAPAARPGGASGRVALLGRRTPPRFVDGMRNIAWIAGLVHRVDETTIAIQQTANIETAILARVPKRYDTRKLNMQLLTLECHVIGKRDEHGPQCFLSVLKIDFPAEGDLPSQKVWESGFGTNPERKKAIAELMKERVNLFDENGIVRPELRPHVKAITDETTGQKVWHLTKEAQRQVNVIRMFGELMELSGGVIDSRIGAGKNVVTIAGLLEAKAYIQPTEHRRGYALLLIRQHADPNQCIPVRVTDARAERFIASPSLVEGKPLLIHGSIRRKVYPRDDNPAEIASAHTYIECVQTSGVKEPVANRDILDSPKWWGAMRDEIAARNAEVAARRQAATQRKSIGRRLETNEVIVVEDL